MKNAPVLRRGREWRRLALLPGLDRVTEHLYPTYERQQLVTVEPPGVPDKHRQRLGLFLAKRVVGQPSHMGRKQIQRVLSACDRVRVVVGGLLERNGALVEQRLAGAAASPTPQIISAAVVAERGFHPVPGFYVEHVISFTMVSRYPANVLDTSRIAIGFSFWGPSIKNKHGAPIGDQTGWGSR